jgi:hypothetical protein
MGNEKIVTRVRTRATFSENSVSYHFPRHKRVHALKTIGSASKNRRYYYVLPVRNKTQLLNCHVLYSVGIGREA